MSAYRIRKLFYTVEYKCVCGAFVDYDERNYDYIMEGFRHYCRNPECKIKTYLPMRYPREEMSSENLCCGELDE